MKLNNKGETFIETLCALMILTIVLTGFSEVISKTALLNATVRNKRVSFNDSQRTEVKDWKVTISEKNTSTIFEYNMNTHEQKGIKMYSDGDNGLYYYEYE